MNLSSKDRVPLLVVTSHLTHYPAKFGSHKFYGSGDKYVLILKITTLKLIKSTLARCVHSWRLPEISFSKKDGKTKSHE